MIDRTEFYNQVRGQIGSLKQKQVDGFEAILDYWEGSDLTDLRWLAYILATAYHETAGTMQAIEEFGKGKGKKYGKKHPKTGKIYYGRGYVQLTFYTNYKKMGEILDIDLVNHPTLALDTNIAIKIMFEGMIHGYFTGKKLSDYFNETVEDWKGARRIVNGQDRAELIGNYGRGFYVSLL